VLDMNHYERLPPALPSVGSNPAASIQLLGFICDQAFACPRTQIYKITFTVIVVNVT
jgi:hypothetical protein